MQWSFEAPKEWKKKKDENKKYFALFSVFYEGKAKPKTRGERKPPRLGVVQ